MRDTLAAAESVRVAAIRRSDPVDRLRRALELSDTVRSLALARLRLVLPGQTDAQLVEVLLRSGRPGVDRIGR